jgi:hypothetical protein
MASTVKRRLTFYAWDDLPRKQAFDRIAGAKAVKKLTGGREIFEDEESISAVLTHTVGTATSPTQFRVLRLREYDDRPLRYSSGSTLAPITLNQGEYTTDVTHIAIWPDGYGAYDAHGNAPGLPTLAAFLADRCDQHVNFVALYDRDLIDRLKELDGIRGIEYSIVRSDKAQRALDAELGVFGGLLAAHKGNEEVSFSTRIAVNRKGGRDRSLDEQTRQEIIELAPRAEEYFDSLHITGFRRVNGKLERVELNMLQTRVAKEVEIRRAKQGGNWPDYAACFQALTDAKKEFSNGVLTDAVRARPKPAKQKK